MTRPDPAFLDVRPILAAGGEPFDDILRAVAALAPGQALRLVASFKPVPLFAALARKGFVHSERPLTGDDWEVLFTPAATVPSEEPATAPAAGDAQAWPAPARALDNRGLSPPEPMVRILETLATMAAGEVLEALNDRDPIFLYPELAKRGHAHRTEPRIVAEGGKAFQILILAGGAAAVSS